VLVAQRLGDGEPVGPGGGTPTLGDLAGDVVRTTCDPNAISGWFRVMPVSAKKSTSSSVPIEM
jgi:hypothetical protein